MTRKWNLPLTYQPKIHPVEMGNCRQTIRILKPGKPKKQINDLIRFYTWKGTPYRSERETITEYTTITYAELIIINPTGIKFPNKWDWTNHCVFYTWDSSGAYLLASWDGIVPPAGEALRDVLFSKNKIPKEGIEAQIIRW
jgi:hypothetical protein